MRKLLWVILSALVALPIAASAEVYKWKDKDGTVRYSDTPPLSNIQQLPIGGKKPSPKPNATAAEGVQDPATAPAPVAPTAADSKKKSETTKGDAVKRQEQAEEEKKKAEQQEAELQAKQQNCSTAKAAMQNYQQGGRIYKMNEKGEREYESDASIARNLEQAKQDVEKYCE